MTSKTHVALGLSIGLGILYFFPSLDTYITISGACIGSLMPDLDTEKSDPSQIFPPIAKVVSRFTKHRGATHTMFPLILIILWQMTSYFPILMMGLGALSHTIIDNVTMWLKIRCQSRGEGIIYRTLWVGNVVGIGMLIARHYNLLEGLYG